MASTCTLRAALVFPLFLVAHAACGAGKDDVSKQLESEAKLQPYIHCDGFAGGVRGVILDRRPQAAKSWREVTLGGRSESVSVIDGYRVTYSYARTYAFASLKAERSDPARYGRDKETVGSSVTEMARLDASLELAEFSARGFSSRTLTKKELSGRTLAMAQIFSDEDSVIVTIFFLNQLPENRKFQSYAEFTALRDAFVRGYVECVAAKRGGAR